jgi:hypothetical protein
MNLVGKAPATAGSLVVGASAMSDRKNAGWKPALPGDGESAGGVIKSRREKADDTSSQVFDWGRCASGR